MRRGLGCHVMRAAATIPESLDATLGCIRRRGLHETVTSTTAEGGDKNPPPFLARLPRGHKLTADQRAELARYSAARAERNRKRVSEYMEWKFLESFGASKCKQRRQQQAYEARKRLMKLKKLSSLPSAASVDSTRREAAVQHQRKKELEEAVAERLSRDRNLMKSLRSLHKSQQQLVALCAGEGQPIPRSCREEEPSSSSDSE